jgi:hypothetical protein
VREKFIINGEMDLEEDNEKILLMLFWVVMLCGLVGRYILEKYSVSIFRAEIK